MLNVCTFRHNFLSPPQCRSTGIVLELRGFWARHGSIHEKLYAVINSFIDIFLLDTVFYSQINAAYMCIFIYNFTMWILIRNIHVVTLLTYAYCLQWWGGGQNIHTYITQNPFRSSLSHIWMLLFVCFFYGWELGKLPEKSLQNIRLCSWQCIFCVFFFLKDRCFHGPVSNSRVFHLLTAQHLLPNNTDIIAGSSCLV